MTCYHKENTWSQAGLDAGRPFSYSPHGITGKSSDIVDVEALSEVVSYTLLQINLCADLCMLIA